MIPAAFDYRRPATLAEALTILAADDPGVKLLAGGQSLLPVLKIRLAEVGTLVDIGHIAELRGIRAGGDGGLIIGAATRWNEILEDPRIAAEEPMLHEAVDGIGDLQVRNRGTIGGSVAHADPAADITAVLLARDASVAVRSATAGRAGPVHGFWRGPFETALGPGELITEIRLPALPPGAGGAYRSVTQAASGYPVAGVAAVVARSAGRIAWVRVGVTGVAEAPYRALATEAALAGSAGEPDALAAAAALVTSGQTALGDPHADADYRAHVATVVARRALEAACARAAG